ncbi:16S rRNA (uracil(1498)-N(3))-methyltransferase [Roseivirga sp. BDSF3-8]|uniref:16S rRNA (uracil(1498)-N(3))-methyltransferase n=1 Tax=Roseivirga sp. BDSF3-8 TaxID=3241598 RepID=UPI0035320A14
MDLYFHTDLEPDVTNLEEEESRHLIKVLRKKEGDTFRLTNGKGMICKATILTANPKRCEVALSERETQQAPPPMALAIAPTKNMDRIEWLTEKAVEIGVEALYFFDSEHSERRVLKTDRLERKALSAMKQSLTAFLPRIEGLMSYEEMLEKAASYKGKYIAWIDEDVHDHLFDIADFEHSCIVLIGPEGDFTPEEVEKAKGAGITPVSLGNKRLRTETAALAALHTLSLLNR